MIIRAGIYDIKHSYVVIKFPFVRIYAHVLEINRWKNDSYWLHIIAHQNTVLTTHGVLYLATMI